MSGMDEKNFISGVEPREFIGSGLLGAISSNTQHAGVALTEDQFFTAMRAAMKYAPKSPPMMVSMGTVRQAQRGHAKSRERADEATRVYRATRRWRWLKRYRALRDFHVATLNADMLLRTFGHLFEPEQPA